MQSKQACLWPWIEFLSSRGQESQQQPVFSGARPGSSGEGKNTRGLKPLSFLSTPVLCFTLTTLWCARVSEWDAPHEASVEPCSVVSSCRKDWRQPPKGEAYWGFIPTCQGQETPNVPVRATARDGQSMWTELSFLSHPFLVCLTIS